MDERDVWKHSSRMVAEARAAAYLRRANRTIAACGAPLVDVLARLSNRLERKPRD